MKHFLKHSLLGACLSSSVYPSALRLILRNGTARFYLGLCLMMILEITPGYPQVQEAWVARYNGPANGLESGIGSKERIYDTLPAPKKAAASKMRQGIFITISSGGGYRHITAATTTLTHLIWLC